VNLRKPERTEKALILTDAIINVALGGLLLVYPEQLVRTLGLPDVEMSFFPRILGGVLVGIGIALALEFRNARRGLGLDGAVAINLCGAGVLAAWLVVRPMDFSPAGRITLWAVSGLVIGLGLVELLHRRAK
jgi:hypothetical protein